jgi:NADH:ubiquinone oxidoreductase subunit 6 (subunit J)
LLPFEITSVILLAALIGVVVLHQPRVSSKQ